MLNFRITNGNLASEIKKLDVVKMERMENPSYTSYASDNYSVISENTDDVTFKFWVKDLYNLQDGSNLTSKTTVLQNNTEDTDYSDYVRTDYYQSVTIESYSKADKCLTFNVKKDIDLDITAAYIQTTFRCIRYSDKWYIEDGDRDYIEALMEDEDNGYIDCIQIQTNQAAYGQNGNDILVGDILTPNYTVFYYENDSWMQIDLRENNLEGCLKNERISLNSFHEYDTQSRQAVQLDPTKLYYTCENYVYITCADSHYFGAPVTHEAYDDDSDEASYYTFNKTTDYGRPIISNVEYPSIYLCFHDYNSMTGLSQDYKIKKECHLTDINKLYFNYDKIKDNAEVIYLETVYMPYYKSKEMSRSITSDEVSLLEEKMFAYGYEVDEDNGDIAAQDCSLGYITFKRDNLLYDETYGGVYELTFSMTTNAIQIPLSLNFETDLYHNDALQTNFVDAAKKNFVNPILDLEKDVYTPAIHKDITQAEINGEYDECYKIIFNLHFREHRDVTNGGNTESWQCSRDAYWNGTRVLSDESGNKIIDLKGRVYNYPLDTASQTKIKKYDYFSYYGETPGENKSGYDTQNDYNFEDLDEYKTKREKRTKLTEYQSDLLSYLGFSNKDVEYQKSKLTKSFLRLSFFDSDNVGNQNLLHTATIFLDGGGLFAKYIKTKSGEVEYRALTSLRNSQNNKSYAKGDILTEQEFDMLDANSKLLCVVSNDLLAITGSSLNQNDTYTQYNSINSGINKEPMRHNAISMDDLSNNTDELERLRLSSQFVVTDKYSSKHSSEGFYFYTYRDNDNGVLPSELYMRVDFNHAGYGRTIPFMMPYIRNNEEELNVGEPGYERYTQSKRLNKIKTFDDICYDWSEIDFDKQMISETDENGNPIDSFVIKDEDEVGYGPVRYRKYTYIKWKYRYDKKTQKHIYYLDPSVYGTSVTSENGHGNNIILNLYEGKM